MLSWCRFLPDVGRGRRPQETGLKEGLGPPPHPPPHSVSLSLRFQPWAEGQAPLGTPPLQSGLQSLFGMVFYINYWEM